MTTFLQIVAIVAVIAGTFFSLVGIVGYVRLPDVYTRLHATGKVGVFGGVLLLAAAVSGTSLSIGKGLVLIALLLIIGPVTSHAIASAAYRVGIPMVGQRNDLQRDGALAGQRLAGEQGQVQDG
ncbi:MAG: monovalent cation/H(+) antiporter subunit G [Anaerolineales bacterium]|nr:monovalent cation/H(+) antiporter subunit G [Anaerolineales bacterium]